MALLRMQAMAGVNVGRPGLEARIQQQSLVGSVECAVHRLANDRRGGSRNAEAGATKSKGQAAAKVRGRPGNPQNPFAPAGDQLGPGQPPGPIPDDRREFPERDFFEGNPLIEKLPYAADIDDEDVGEDDDEDEDEDDALNDELVGHARDFRPLGGDSNLSFSNGGMEKSAMARIAEKLSSIPGERRIYESTKRAPLGWRDGPDGEVGRRYGQPMLPGVGPQWSTPDHPVPVPSAPKRRNSVPEAKFPWEMEDGEGENWRRLQAPSLAELTLPEDELRRLRSLGVRIRRRVKVGVLEVNNRVVEKIHSEWANSEVVKIKCEGPTVRSMKRIHDALEERTGGLVVWRAGGACLVYRGKNYVPPPPKEPVEVKEPPSLTLTAEADQSEALMDEDGVDYADEGGSSVEDSSPDHSGMEGSSQSGVALPRVSSVYDPEEEREMEETLSALGPRYDDWTGMKPVPVDADLLLDSSVQFTKPFRLMPHGVNPKLSDTEMTNLRRLSRQVPPHFVLGVNKGLDGLAAAIVKLWEKKEIAKIAVKRGVQNTNHKMMGDHLKRLTGGVPLSRDKYFIVLYRGKDFLPEAVAEALRPQRTVRLSADKEKEQLVSGREEAADSSAERSVSGTVTEALEGCNDGQALQDNGRRGRAEARTSSGDAEAMRIQRRMSITLAKKERAELQLQKVEKRVQASGPPVDRETITEEERNMYKKLGVKMHPFLLLGRRGVFGGTVENMHLHWKHRELVKLIYKAKDRVDLEQTARMLEYESGGILVATTPTSKGQAIIFYRGKNYQRPPLIRPRNLLTKREALKRSIEMQREESLSRHLLELERNIGHMQADLGNLREKREEGEARADRGVGNGDEEVEEQERQDQQSAGSSRDLDNLSEMKMDGDIVQTKQSWNPNEVFRADPLSRKEKLLLRQQALKERKRPAHFNVGRSNVVFGLGKAIRKYFQRRSLVTVGVKGRARGTPIEEILFQLEEATGGTLVSMEHAKIILYRGWPDRQQRPTEETGHWEELPPKLRGAMMAEAEIDDDYSHESDQDESDDADGDIDKQDELLDSGSELPFRSKV